MKRTTQRKSVVWSTSTPRSRKHHRSGFNWLDRYTWDWLGDLRIYRLEGTVRYPAVNACR